MRSLIIIVLLLSGFVLFAADSLNISLLTEIELSALRGVDVHAGHVFAFAKSPKLYSLEYVCGGGLFLVDSLTFSGFAMPGHSYLSGRWIECAEGKAYLADWTSGFHVADISDHLALALDTTINSATTTRGVFPSGDSLFVASNSIGMHLYNISDGTAYISTMGVGSAVMDAIGYPDGTVLIAESGADFSIWDLDMASSPIGWQSLSGEAVKLGIKDNLAFVASWGAGMHILDIADLTSPSLVASVDLWDDEVYDIETWGENHLVLAVGSAGISVVNLGTGAAIWQEGYYTPDGANIVDVAINANLAFAADTDGRLYCFDLSELTSINETPPTPDHFTISAYPNPFNAAVTIAFDCHSREGGNPEGVSVEILDMNGRRIALIARRADARRGNLLDDNEIAALPEVARNDAMGKCVWQPAPSLGSGVYLVRATIEDESISKRIVYLK